VVSSHLMATRSTAGHGWWPEHAARNGDRAQPRVCDVRGVNLLSRGFARISGTYCRNVHSVHSVRSGSGTLLRRCEDATRLAQRCVAVMKRPRDALQVLRVGHSRERFASPEPGYHDLRRWVEST